MFKEIAALLCARNALLRTFCFCCIWCNRFFKRFFRLRFCCLNLLTRCQPWTRHRRCWHGRARTHRLLVRTRRVPILLAFFLRNRARLFFNNTRQLLRKHRVDDALRASLEAARRAAEGIAALAAAAGRVAKLADRVEELAFSAKALGVDAVDLAAHDGARGLVLERMRI